MLLEVQDLSVRYGRRLALSDVSLRVPEASLVALVGANGAGKTTALKAISGLLTHTSGSVVFGGEQIGRAHAHTIARSGLALVPEGRGILPSMTVAENLRLGLLGIRDKAAREGGYERVFGHFPVLKQRLGAQSGLLSGGEQQMLSLGRSLLKNPRLLMIDEMSLGLAPQIVDHLFDVVAKLKAEGTAVLCVEQNTSLILAKADYAYVINTGRTVIEGTGREVLNHPELASSYLGTGTLHSGGAHPC